MSEDINYLCDGKPYTLVVRDNDTPLLDEIKWLKENVGLPIMYPNDGRKWGAIVSSEETSVSTRVDYFFLDPNDAMLFKLAMV